ncbi:Y-family DNA polymerase [Prevotella sp. 10(H)]|uniref:Y-family DNA polymerase n=1 Tax=Prevotella sp. 10(H) TaxID=1158294 RepID=UPI00068DFCAD|nr:Y-family DNA polymerase [Prevotella sp. 10(H)]
MIAICDANYFYVACHMLVEPRLWNKPVIVWSNNRGVIVSLNPAAKKLGFRRGMVSKDIERDIKIHGVITFESNYQFYEDISARFLFALSEKVEKMQKNSIDEAFLSLKGFGHIGYDKYCREIRDYVKKNVGLPTGIGVGTNKTLAKISSRFAKQYTRFENVFVMDTEQKRIECLKRTPIKNVWGLGGRLSDTLISKDIKTAYDFVSKVSQKQARSLYNVDLERTWCELNGEICYELETVEPDRKGISVSRTFQKEIESLDGIRQAVATYTAVCAENLRSQRSYARSITVYLETNRFRKQFGAYNPDKSIKLPVPTDTTPMLIRYALALVDNMFVQGFKYKKAGVVINGFVKSKQTVLFDPQPLDDKFALISPVEDFYSHGFDRKLLSQAVMGYGEGNDIIERNISDCPTTNFRQIIRIDCD